MKLKSPYVKRRVVDYGVIGISPSYIGLKMLFLWKYTTYIVRYVIQVRDWYLIGNFSRYNIIPMFLMILPVSQGLNLVKLSTVSFESFASEL